MATPFDLVPLNRRALLAAAWGGTMMPLRLQAAEPSGLRVALVIGNAAYAAGPLLNPTRDAQAMT
jgi:hypothetical protein